MRALILAAGRGSRMGDGTTHRPKGLTELWGRSLLEWQLDTLKQAGIQELGLVTGYLPEVLEEFARRYGARTFHNPRWHETNMVASLFEAHEWLSDGPCLVSYADIVYRVSTARGLAEIPGEHLTVAFDRRWRELWQVRFEDPLSDAESFLCDEQLRLLDIGRKTTSYDEIQGQYMGLVRWNPASFARARALSDGLPAPQADRLDMTSLLQRLLAAGERIDCFPVEGGWCEVDHQQDVEAYRVHLESGRWSHDWRSGP